MGDIAEQQLVTLHENPRGSLKIWEHPEPERHYIIAADVCEGRKQDWHVQQVWGLPMNPDELPEMVAKWKNCTIDALEAGQVAWQLGLYYNTALLAVERNGPGVSMLDFLKHATGPHDRNKGWMRTGYPNIYRDHGPLAQVKKQVKAALGWRTQGTSKRAMLEQAQRMIHDLGLVIHCPDTINELLGFKWDYDKRDWIQSYENAVTGRKNDDEVIALSIFTVIYYRWGNRKWFTSFKTAEV